MPAKRKAGRPVDERRAEYLRRFEIATFKPERRFTQEFMDQLDRCADDEARRLLIGRDGRNE